MALQWQSPTGPTVASLSAFDDGIKSYMTQAQIRGGAIAVVHEGRLVLARGYTNADPGYPQILPTSLFRIASLSKVLTAMVMYELIDADPSLATRSVQNILQLTTPSGDPVPNDPKPSNLAMLGNYFGALKVEDLLRHRGGWDRDLLAEPTYLQDQAIADAFGVDLPITKMQLARWGTTRPMHRYPGTECDYCNFGYLLVGMLIEKLMGKPYAEVVHERLLAPLGVTRPRILRVREGDRAPDEVRYHTIPEELFESVVEPGKSVQAPYGYENLENCDSFGGWIMSAPDYARVLAAFIRREAPLPKNPEAMGVWEPPGNTNKRGGGVTAYQHGGVLPGSWAAMTVRSDKLAIVVLFNTSTTNVATFTHQGVTWGIGNHMELWQQIAEKITDWPKHDLFAAMLPPDSPPREARTGVWSPGTHGQFVSWRKTMAQHELMYSEQWKNGLRLIDQQTYEIDGKWFYDGIWNQSAVNQFVSWGKSRAQHEQLYADWWAKGYRLIHQQTYGSTTGELRYDGVWNPSTAGQFVSWNKTRAQHEQLYADWWAKGFRLLHQQAYVVDGELRYDGIWTPNTGGQFVSWGKPLAQHDAMYAEQWAKGLRLMHQQAYYSGGQLLFDGIWKPDTRGQFVSWAKSRNQLHADYAVMYSQGMRLIGQTTHVSPPPLLRGRGRG